MRRIIWCSALACVLLVLGGCTSEANNRRAVYLLLDTSGTYSEELGKANAIINYLLGTLETGESLAIARIDSGSFSEKDILVKATFDDRPSVANRQKRAFREKLDAFFREFSSSPHTDIRGGLLQATEYLNETGAKRKYVLIFSDLEEDLQEGHIREFVIPLEGIRVVALNVTKLRTDNIDPRDYLKRLDLWEVEVQRGGGSWRVMNDLDRLDRLLQGA